MKLAAKLVAIIAVVLVVLLIVDVYVSVQGAIRLFDADLERDAGQFGRMLRDLVQDAWRANGREATLKLIDQANAGKHRMKLRWVWLDAAPGDPHHPGAPAEHLVPVTQGEEAFFQAPNGAGERCFFAYIPVVVSDHRRGALELSKPLSKIRQYSRDAIMRTLVLAVVMLAAGGFAVVLAGVRVVGRPLARLIDKTRRVGMGDLAEPLHLHGHDELSELAAALNTMCEQLAEGRTRVRAETEARIAALEQLRHADRLKTVGRLASGIAHELGTPLNVVSGRATMIIGGRLRPEEIVENATIIKAQSGRMTKIIRQLLDFARCRAPDRSVVDLHCVTRQTLELLAALAQKHKVTAQLTNPQEPALAHVDVGQIQQVLTNIIVNAVQAMPQGGTVDITCHHQRVRSPENPDGDERDYLRVDVRDQGVGIPEEHLRHVFEPFFTTKDIGEGTGLGLSIAYEIVREHAGWIDVASEPGRGTCFSIHLPRVTA